MWLLRTDRAELHYFSRPPPKFAILSHVWWDHELSFQDLQALHSVSASGDDNPRSRASPKIRDCCIYAESEGYEWLWVDTCCIDKTSSAELSEAVNSMYSWYAFASVCYAYLQDVHAEKDGSVCDASIRRSRWFTRGWTLQELIAPKDVHFLSAEWRWLGTKRMFASFLDLLTGIDSDVLTFAKPVTAIPVAKRMSWAARRETTRVEDEAYALMGIFGVNMPTIYGEGRRAFRRLQEEIIRSSADHTLFAWGPSLPFPGHFQWAPSGGCCESHGQDRPYFQNLLACSPLDFAGFSGISVIQGEALEDTLQKRMVSASEKGPSLFRRFVGTSQAKLGRPAAPEHVPQKRVTTPLNAHHVADFTVTSLGIRAHLPVITAGAISVALLACRGTVTSGAILGLVLRRVSEQSPLHHVGGSLLVDFARLELSVSTAHSEVTGHHVRWILFDPADATTRRLLGLSPSGATYQWTDIYIRQESAMVIEDQRLALGPRRPVVSSSPFDSMVLDPCWVALFDIAIAWLEQQGFQSEDPWLYDVNRVQPSSVLTYTFTHVVTHERFVIRIGQCLTWESWSRLWVTVEFSARPPSTDSEVEPQQASLPVPDPIHGPDVRLRCDSEHLGDWDRDDSLVACPVDVDKLEPIMMYSRAFPPPVGSASGTVHLTVLDKWSKTRSATAWIYPDFVPHPRIPITDG
ncbi:HET-domain-containing protein [Polyporus arcularius HHB13444]|uniref:HET-domain-containing protein n=1 Tax=Polyporus arcularius HHB13444 TaxID=1314778 RepID=A0A5C3P2N0_9APHY|nr:HET-domain-containing protein [Polyporus arcularius HHB13444]